MVSETEINDIANLADISIPKEELGTFTAQFNSILEYFDLLDAVEAGPPEDTGRYNIFREDIVEPSLDQDAVLSNPGSSEDEFIKGPRVM